MTELYQFDADSKFYTGARVAQIDPLETNAAREFSLNTALGKKAKIVNGIVVEVNASGEVKTRAVPVFDSNGVALLIPEVIEPREIDSKTLRAKIKMVPLVVKVPIESDITLPDQKSNVVYCLPGQFETLVKPPTFDENTEIAQWNGKDWAVIPMRVKEKQSA